MQGTSTSQDSYIVCERCARERAEDFMAANQAIQRVAVVYMNRHFMLDRSGVEAFTQKVK